MNVKANVSDDRLGLWTKTDIIELSCNVQLYLTAIMSWNDDVAYALTPLKLLTQPLGVWPLQKHSTFSLTRCIMCIFSLVRFYFHLTYYNKVTILLVFSIIKFDSSSEMLSAAWTQWKQKTGIKLRNKQFILPVCVDRDDGCIVPRNQFR